MKEQIEAVRRMQNYIAEHYTEEITPAALAEASMFSPWYARRLFEKWTGRTPADYVRRLRLSRSALMLRDEGCSVTEAAMESGFQSVDGYQRAFLREFGRNPKEYARHPVPVFLFTPYEVTDPEDGKEETTMAEVRNVFVTVCEKPARKVIVKRGVKADEYMSYCEEVGCEIWGLLMSIRSPEGEPVCMWLPEKYRDPVTNVYVQGAEVPLDYDGIVPEGLDVIELPACTYLRFKGEKFAEEDYERAIAEVWQAEDRFDYADAGFARDGENPRIQLAPVGERGYIELVPVKKI